MTRRLPAFLSGMLTTVLIGGLGISALAATGQLTITVDPINIQVNGETFQPKDAQGAEVPVFAYNGTTYAPLRALAEAYGLEVGYDAEANMATVIGDVSASSGATTPTSDTTAAAADYSDWTAEEDAAYQEFKGYWTLELRQEEIQRVEDMGKVYLIYGTLTNFDDLPIVKDQWNGMSDTARSVFSTRLIEEYYQTLAPVANKYFARLQTPTGDIISIIEPPLKDGTYFKVSSTDFS